MIPMTSNTKTTLQSFAAVNGRSSHSLVNLQDDDLDSVNSGHRHNGSTEPTPQLLNGKHFTSQHQERYFPLTSGGNITTSMDERRPIGTEEKLVKTSSIWLLTTMSRAGAVHLLKDKETGIFIVRKSSQPDSLALSVQSRLPNHCTVDHYIIESTNSGFRLQGSAHVFHSIPSLIAYYVENMDEIPYHLRLPTAIQQAKSTRELASLDLLGQDFWVSSFSKTSQSSKLILGTLQKSCSEPVNIQQPHGTVGSKHVLNNLPSKSASDSSHLMTRPNVGHNPRPNTPGTRSHTVDRTGSRSQNHSQSNHHNETCQGSLQSSSHATAATVTKATLIGIPHASQNTANSDTVIGQFSRESSLENPVLSSETHICTCRASEDDWTISSDFVVHRRQHNSMLNTHAEDLNIYRTDPSNQVVVKMDSVQQFQREQTSLFCSLPSRHQHSPKANFSRNHILTDTESKPKSKSNLYFTTNLDLLEMPENSYFRSNLSDRMSDYEDIWRNSCSEFDVDRRSPIIVHDSQFSCDNNNNNARETKQIIVRDTPKHSTSHHIINTGHEAMTKSMLGLTALEQARIIAGSSSDYVDDDDAAVTDLFPEDNEEIRNIFTEKSLQLSTSFLNKCSTCNSEAVTKQTDISAVSRFLDFNQQNETDLSFKSETSEVFAGNHALSVSACSFNTSVSVNGTTVAQNELTYACTDVIPTCRNKTIRLPSRLDNLSRKKSSSESSLIAAPSPPYAEPADTVRLRDKKGRDINIQIRRRSAPSSVSFRVKDRTGKTQQSKVSQHPELETIFSPGTHTDSSTEARFVFDISNISTQPKPLHAGGNSFQNESHKISTDISETQKQRSKIHHKRIGTTLRMPNGSSSESQYQRKTLATVVDSDGFNLCLPLISQNPAVIMSPSASRFPVGLQQDQRVSTLSDSSTVQDLIFCRHPELSVRPLFAGLNKVDETVESAQSEYDNLGYNTSTLGSLATVYSPPWDTTSTRRLIEEVQSNHKMLPDMNTQDRIEHWQKANNTFFNSNNPDETFSSCDKNKLGNSSSHLDVDQSQQYSLQQQLLFQHQHKIKTRDSAVKVHQVQTNPTVDSMLHLNQNTASGRFIQKEEEQKKRWSYQGIDSKQISPPSTPRSTDDMVITNKRKGQLLPPLRLSSQCPDVVNCHNKLASQDSAAVKDSQQSDVFKAAVLAGQTEEEADVVLRRDVTHLPPMLAQQSSDSQNDDWKTPEKKIRDYIVMLSSDQNTIFGSTIENFIQCTVESHERNPQHVMRNVRQFLSGIKNYLVKHGEGELKSLIEMERNKLATNEILNIDAIIEKALHVCVLKPLKYHIYKLFVDTYSQNGALEQLARNIQYARTKSPQELGVKPGLKLPQSKDMEVIKYYLDLMQRSYSPLQKLQNLLKATSAINDCVQSKNNQLRGQRTLSLGADEFLPTLIHVIVHCGLVSAEIEADFMWGLLHPSLMVGEAGYCLTTLSSAVLILKNFEDTHKLSPAQMENRLTAISDMQGFLKIAIPDELNGTITWRTLPVRPNITARDVCAMVAHKLKVTNSQDYGLFMLIDGLERQLTDSDSPQMMKCDNLAMGKSCCFAFKRIDANIAWPRHMKHSTSEDLLSLPVSSNIFSRH